MKQFTHYLAGDASVSTRPGALLRGVILVTVRKKLSSLKGPWTVAQRDAHAEKVAALIESDLGFEFSYEDFEGPDAADYVMRYYEDPDMYYPYD